MQPELVGVIMGGIIGISGSVLTTILFNLLQIRQRHKSIIRITNAEITAIMEKAERFLEGKSNLEELRSSTPLWTSLTPELGFLSIDQGVAARRTITLDMEMRKMENQEKAEECKNMVYEICELRSGSGQKSLFAGEETI